MIRDIFAAVGICESSKQVEAKPRLRTQLMNLVLPYSKTIATQNGEELSAYEERLKAALDLANYKQLNHMINQNIMPVLDHRLSEAKHGWRSSEIYATLYQQNGQRMLALFDRGDLDKGFWERGNLDHIAKLFEITAAVDFNEPQASDVYLGKIYMMGKVPSLKWQSPEQMSYECQKNPWVSEPTIAFKTLPPKTPHTPKPKR
jgi:hypothetical protein